MRGVYRKNSSAERVSELKHRILGILDGEALDTALDAIEHAKDDIEKYSLVSYKQKIDSISELMQEQSRLENELEAVRREEKALREG